ncbi:neutral zinc metallopeptidase [Marinobacter sp. F4218]|uniref:KPN_02809 family neutral zinc metallopeptidase n=1 Tax=Marinobacter sp. F4218 TaxID=2862868 RepID=UPI001C62A0B8|nr:neutral zinc metallopeptidase [Marinobacter sp. F4218]MBW7470606.1 zinc metallopeptidase [Marinobacter sp. F4218]
MRWRSGRRSDNIEDRRGQTQRYSSAGAGGILLLRLLTLLFRSKIGRVILIAGVAVVLGGKFLGIDLLPMLTGGTTTAQAPREFSEAEQQLADFTSVVLADTEDTWRTIFNGLGGNYREPTLVLFSDQVQSACGFASAAVGPFYCPGDQKVYLDLSFFEDLARRFGAPGDFAQAYVIAHEVGHHVQTLMGISQEVRQAGQGRSQEEINGLSVRQELQADCFSGVWGHIAHRDRQILEPGDLDEALIAASAIGDDRLQRRSGGQVVPDSFTHGTSEQRVRWFRRGFESGDIEACNTFAAESL